MKFPVVAFYKNILFTSDKKVYGAYKMLPVPWRFLPQPHKEVAVGTLEEPLTGFAGGRGQILLLHEEVALDEERYLQECNVPSELDDSLRVEAEQHALAAKERIATKGARKKRRYILFELDIRQAVSSLNEFIETARDVALKNFLGNKVIIPEKIKALAEEAEEEMLLSLMRFGMHRIGFADLDFIIRRTADRLGVFSVSLPDRQSGKMNEALIASFTDGAIAEEKINYMTVLNGSGEEQYHSYVYVTDAPKKIPPFGYDMLSSDNLGFPVDVVIHFEIIMPHRARQKVDTKKRLLRAQMGEATGIGESPEIMEETGMNDSKILEVKTESGQPLARMSLCFGLASRNIKELHSRVKRLRQHLTNERFYAVRPLSRQEIAMWSFLPGAQPAAPWIECDPGYIAAIGPGFATDLGDPKGFYLGWSGLSPVHFLPGRPAKELNKTNAILISGSLGGGKSHMAKLLAYFILLSGGYVFATDPKQEYHPFEELFPGLVKSIELSPRSNTSFNPFTLSADIKRAKSIAMDYLTRALNAASNEPRRLAIADAVDKVVSLPEKDRHMDACTKILETLATEHPDKELREQAMQSTYLLKYLKGSDIGSLIFGKKNVGLFTGKERMIVANIKELPRPQQGVRLEEWTESERQGAAVIYLLAAMARETAFGLPREVVKMFAFDESWVLRAISEGRRLLDEIIRIGRTFNLIPALITQNMSDVDDPVIVNNVSQVFCFRAYDPDEVKTNLKVLGADLEAVSTKNFAGLPAGTCLYRDAEGRIDWLRVDPQPVYLNDIFDTKPTAAIRKKVQYA